jgi:hypothetical protein
VIKVASGLASGGNYPFERPSPTRGDATKGCPFHLKIDNYPDFKVTANHRLRFAYQDKRRRNSASVLQWRRFFGFRASLIVVAT